MASSFISFLFPFLLCSLYCISPTESKLSLDYYSKTCPKFEDIVMRVVTDKQMSTPTTAAAALRLFFHDCMVDGCDGSILIASTPTKKSERDADINRSLPGDGYDVVTRVKTALELECPGIVSCADVIAMSTRNLVKMVGGPLYKVRLGRKDSIQSDANRITGNLALPNMTVNEIIPIFNAKGLAVQDMVALLGAHTIGFTHCKEFAHRIFNFSPTSQTDPAMDPDYATALRKLCANYTVNQEIAAFNDVFTPGQFDNMYFKNLRNGMALLPSDQLVAMDPRTKPFVDLYAKNQTLFFKDFAHAMEKVSITNVKTGKKGEVRLRCDKYNSYQG